MSTSKQKRLAREYAEKHGVKYTDALRTISRHPARISSWDGEQARGVLTYRLGSYADIDGPYDLHLGGGSPHVLITGRSGSGGESVWETIAAQVLTKQMRWDPSLTGHIMLIDPKGDNFSRWDGRKGVEVINGRGTTSLGGEQAMIASLDRALDECQRRMGILATHSVSHWLDLPSPVLAGERLAPLIVILPAFASHEESVLARMQRRATQLAQVGRVAGVHLIVVSNTVIAAIIPHALRGSLVTRVVMGRVPTIVDRMMFGDVEVQPGEDGTSGSVRSARVMNSIGTEDSVPDRVQIAGVHEEMLNRWLPRINGNNDGIGVIDRNIEE